MTDEPETEAEPPSTVAFSPELEAAGGQVMWQVLRWHDWCHRKVESLQLLENERARRRVSVDMTPEKIILPSRPSQVLVPVAWVAKGTMRSFDFTDAAGASVPVLGRTENASVSVGLALALVNLDVVSRDLKLDDPAQVRTLVEGICTKDALLAEKDLESLLNLIAVGSVTRFVLRAMATCFLLVAVLDSEAAGRRQVLKYSYHWEAVSALPVLLAPTRRVALARRALRLWNSLRVGLGLGTALLELEVAGFDTAASYHLEIPCPPGLLSTGLTVMREEPMPGQAGSPPRVVTSVAHAQGTFATYERDPSERVRAQLQLCLSPSGLHGTVTFAAISTAAIFVAAWAFPGAMQTLPVAADGAASLLLFGPALVIATLVRPGENVITGYLYRPLRYAAVALAVMLFGAGASLVGGLETPWLGLYWCASALLSVTLAILLIAGRVVLTRMYRSSEEGSGA